LATLGKHFKLIYISKKLNANERVQQELIYLLAETKKIVTWSYYSVLSSN